MKLEVLWVYMWTERREEGLFPVTNKPMSSKDQIIRSIQCYHSTGEAPPPLFTAINLQNPPPPQAKKTNKQLTLKDK